MKLDDIRAEVARIDAAVAPIAEAPIDVRDPDQGSDTRDELLALHDYCQAATRAGVPIGPVLTQVAALSSDEDKYGMGSARGLLLRHVPGREGGAAT